MSDQASHRAFHAVLDAIDIETYLICSSAQQGHALALQLGRAMNLGDVDVMHEDFDGIGMRVRLRTYVHRPAARYGWLGGGPA